MNHRLQVRGLPGSTFLARKLARRYNIWKTLAGFSTTRDTAVGEYPTRHLVHVNLRSL
jgi:hypothetical protein